MKILSLSFKNINSLKGEHEIDFTSGHFSQNPLFAITGPTGSGKTTLLDVVSLALFCEVPRIGKISNSDIEDKGAILTKNQKEAYAEVCYSCNAGKFVSVWSISTNRNDKLRPYEMELSQLEPQQTLDLKKSEVPAKNEGLIGLSYSQFIKSVVLAQGEFAKFLKADKKERSQLLEQITGTGIYRELGIKAFRKYKDESDAIEQQVKILESEKEGLLSEERQENLSVAVKEAQENLIGIEKRLEHLKTQLRLQTELQDLTTTLEDKKSKLTDEENREKAFLEEHGKAMQNHETVQGFSAELQAWKYKNEALQKRKTEKENLVRQEKQLQEEQLKKIQEIRGFIGSETDQKNAEKALQEFYVKVDALQQKRNIFQQQYREKEKLFAREIEALSLEWSAKELLNAENRWHDFTKKTTNEFQQARKNFRELPTDLNAETEILENELKVIQNAQNDQRFIQKASQDLAQTKKKLDELKRQLKPLPEQLKTATQTAELQHGQLKNLRLEQENNLMHAQLEDYRKKLEHGKPCPLCGAKEHPFAEEKPPKTSGLAKKINAKEKELNLAQNACSKLKTQQEELIKQKVEKKTELNAQKQELGEQRAKFSRDYGEKFSLDETGWAKKISAKNNTIEQLKNLDQLQKKQNSIERAIPIFNALQKIIGAGRELKAEIEKHYTGENLIQDVRKFENSWQDLQQKSNFTNEKLATVNEQLISENADLSTLENELLPKLNATGFASIPQAGKSLMPIEKFRQFQKQVHAIRESVTSLKSELKTLKKQSERLKGLIKTTLKAGALKIEKENVEKALKEIQDVNNERTRILKNNDDLLKKTTQREQKIKGQQQKNQRWKILSELIGSATGDKFNQFAQDLTLRHLLKLANQRLAELSERYRLVPSERNSGGLVVADLDMGGQCRSVKTLSGGETFLLSLSLALALSDLASKNISINSLFIDEGFGTLDPETLDQTLDTLERLQAASAKTIGIISHVESLKERIGTQIQLRRDGRGYSSLKVVSN